jgi:hypothetical protein
MATVEKEEPQSVAVLTPPSEANSIISLIRPLDPSLPVVEHLDLSEWDQLPVFSTQQVAQIFFQRSAAWIRWVDRRGLLYHDSTGRKVTVTRLGDPDNGMKRYSLSDVETTARILHQNRQISTSRLQIALQIIHLIAVGYGVVQAE